jgi:hypothetical protein
VSYLRTLVVYVKSDDHTVPHQENYFKTMPHNLPNQTHVDANVISWLHARQYDFKQQEATLQHKKLEIENKLRAGEDIYQACNEMDMLQWQKRTVVKNVVARYIHDKS